MNWTGDSQFHSLVGVKSHLIVLLTLVYCLASVQAAVVVNDNILLEDGAAFGADYALTVFQDEAATDPTSVWFNFSAPTATLSFVTVNIDESSDWYLTSEFDEFSDMNIIGGSFQVLVKSTATGFEIGDIEVGPGGFFLGVNTGLQEAPDDPFPPRNVFGWVQLRNTPLGLAIIESAVSYQGRGIVVGTAQVIPEPSVVPILIAVLLLAFFRKPRRKR